LVPTPRCGGRRRTLIVGAPAGLQSASRHDRQNSSSTSWYCQLAPAATNHAITVCTGPFRAQGRPPATRARSAAKTVVHKLRPRRQRLVAIVGSSQSRCRKDGDGRTRYRGHPVRRGWGSHRNPAAACGSGRCTSMTRSCSPNVRFSLARSVDPHSSHCLEQHATPAFKQTGHPWTRIPSKLSNLAGMPGTPVEFIALVLRLGIARN